MGCMVAVVLVAACTTGGDSDGSTDRDTGPIPGLARCELVSPNEEIHCPYHPLQTTDDLVYLDLSTGAIRTGSVSRPDASAGAVLFDPFPELGWGPGATSISPDGERALTARGSDGCSSLDCSFGRLTPWLAEHLENDPEDPSDDTWRHVNLTRRGLGRNVELHGWTTWLHEDLALFNALVRPDDSGWITRQEDNTTQIYAVRLDGEVPRVEPFAETQLWRDNCLTGRVSAQPATGGCFDGQRVSFVRRCYDEPHTPSAWAWHNSRNVDGTGGACVEGAPIFEVPVLRTYVVELDRACVPTRSFEDLAPVREPPDGPVERQLGVVPEWGDMLSSISPDGRWVAFATNMGDPATPADGCAGFRMNLTDSANPMSGNATRRTTVCALDASLRCTGTPTLLGAERTPPESTPLPTFVVLSGGEMTVVHGREWAVPGLPTLRDLMRVDFETGPDARVPLEFARTAIAGQAIYLR